MVLTDHKCNSKPGGEEREREKRRYIQTEPSEKKMKIHVKVSLFELYALRKYCLIYL